MTVADFALDGVGKEVYLIKDNKIIGLAYSAVSSGFIVSLQMRDDRAKALVANSKYVEAIGVKHSYFRFEAFNGTYVGNEEEKLEELKDVLAVEKDRLHRAMCDKAIFGKVPGFGDWYGVLSKDNELSKPTRVKYPMSEEVWNKVVVEAKEEHTVEDEQSDHFIVTYPVNGEFIKASARFAGMIEYEVL